MRKIRHTQQIHGKNGATKRKCPTLKIFTSHIHTIAHRQHIHHHKTIQLLLIYIFRFRHNYREPLLFEIVLTHFTPTTEMPLLFENLQHIYQHTQHSLTLIHIN